MAKRKSISPRTWFDNCGGWRPRHDLAALRSGIAAGLLDAQDEYGMTALALAVASGWAEGVAALLGAGADTELRYFRTGETALHLAVHEGNGAAAADLVAAGADPDAPNYWGVTPRAAAARGGAKHFAKVPRRKSTLPPPRIQNAEHLADHYHPQFQIPERGERETLPVGTAVDLYVYGPASARKQDTVKVRVTARTGRRPRVRYTAAVETTVARTHLAPGTSVVEFGPENVASVYVRTA